MLYFLGITLPNSRLHFHFSLSKSIPIVFLLLCANIIFSQQLAFPGAEGYGKHSTGGRTNDTQVIIVNTLEDVMDNNDGLTSLREAVQYTSGPRIVVFAVGGVFDMTHPTYVGGSWNIPNHTNGAMWINTPNFGNLTIAGQTAPAPGVVIKGTGFYIQNADNIIFQYLTIRNVDPSTPGFTPNDAAEQSANIRLVRNVHNAIFDHLTMSWSTDNSFTASYPGSTSYSGNTTDHISVTNSIIAEGDGRSSHQESLILESCLDNPTCVENNTVDVISRDEEYRFGQTITVQISSCHNPARDDIDACAFGHAMGPRSGSSRADAIVEKFTFYKNFVAHNYRRNPRFASSKMNWINNVVYNWGGVGLQIDQFNRSYGGQYNIIGNYYKAGPQSTTVSTTSGNGPAAILIEPNIFYHIQDNQLEVQGSNNQDLLANQPIPNLASFQDIVVPIVPSSGLVDSPNNDFFSAIGNSKYRDSHDQRVIDEFFSRTGRLGIGGDHVRIYNYQDTPVGNYYTSVDTDADGIADTWEIANGLVVGVDDATDFAADGYLNIEKYIHACTTNDIEDDTTPSSFTPDTCKTYYIDSPFHNLRLAANGEAEDAYTTSTATIGSEVEWVFIANEIGSWHIQKAAGGTNPRLRTRNNGGDTDMQPTTATGTFSQWVFTIGDLPNSYYATLPYAPGDLRRLQINSSGEINMVDFAKEGSWESFRFTEVSTTSDCSSCFDGILNGDEEYIDCGGQFCTPCEECPYETIIVNEAPVPDDLNLHTSNWIQSNGYVSPTGDVSLKAANFVELQMEFEVKLGGELFINIEGCSND